MESLRVDRAMEMLRDEFVAHIAVTTEDGPYVSPISFVFTGDDIVFRTRPGARLAALVSDPRTCVEVSTYDPQSGAWECVIVRGRARRFRDESSVQRAMSALLEKYRPVLGSALSPSGTVPLGDEVIVAVSVDEISGRTSGSFFGVRTRPGRF
jgi:nitroimidazol reductase NimA-like FMN-containing flavoprotein (pyridoxamine 5'-phosphate oxidase superfamily)